MNVVRFFRTAFLQNTSGWLLLLYNSCLLYTLQLYIAGNFQVVKISFTEIFFSFSLTNACSPWRLRKAYVVLWAGKRFIGSDAPKHVFDQFWKFQFHVEHFPRNTRFLSFDGPRNCLYLFKNHRQTYSWPGERPSSQLKVTTMWFVLNIKYLSEPFLAVFCYRKGISCLSLVSI